MTPEIGCQLGVIPPHGLDVAAARSRDRELQEALVGARFDGAGLDRPHQEPRTGVALAERAEAFELFVQPIAQHIGVDLGIDLAHPGGALAGGRAPIDDAAAARMSDQGLISRDGDRLVVTEAGALLLDAILPALVLDRVSG